MNFKQRIHHNFAEFAYHISQSPRMTLCIATIVTVMLCASLGNLRIDTSNESNLDKNHPSVALYHEFHDLFGFEESLIIMVKTPEVFNLDFLSKLLAFHQRLELEVVHLDNIKSMINTNLTYGLDDELIVEDLLQSFPSDEKELNHFKQQALNDPTFRDLFLSKNHQLTALHLYQTAYSPELLNGKKQAFTSLEQHEYVESVRAIAAEFQNEDFDIQLGGGPMIGDTLLTRLATETPLFAALANSVIMILLFALFRRISAVFLPLLVVNMSLASLFGLMAWFDVALSSFSQILPSFILTVGVCDSVHFLSHFYQRFEEHGDKEKAIKQAMSHTGMPMMLTSLTTAVGMLSFAITEIVPIRALGLFAAAGVIIVWFYTIVLMPALLSLININNAKKGQQTLHISQRYLTRFGMFAWFHPKTIVMCFSLLLIAALLAVSQLRFEHDPVKWLPDESETPQAIKLMNEQFHGAIAIEIMADTGKENGIKTVQFLEKLEALNTLAKEFSAHGVQMQLSNSIVNTVKQIHKGLNNQATNTSTLPKTDDLIAQEILLFEMSGGSDLERQVTSDFSTARITLLGPWRDLIGYSNYLIELEDEVKTLMADVAEVSFTGVVYLLSPIQKLAIHTMAKSYTSAVFIITIMMILMIGSLKLGLLSMIPNLLPIILGMGFMAIAGMPLDLYSILIGSIAIGLVVDDTVHFIHGFQYHYEKYGDAEKAVKETLNNTGNALLFTTILLFGGFMTYSFSELINMADFGMITGCIVVLALIADIVLLPALLRLIYGRQKKPTLTEAL